MGSPHQINGFVVQLMFDDKIKIIYPGGAVLWTSNFSIVRETVLKESTLKIENQLKLF
tara:strand:+ start:7101 stop:7274 length:174 start_codon:yes stop_codon:yes gene_type:complete